MVPPAAVRGVFGSNLNEHYGVEALLLLGTSDSRTGGVTIKADSGGGVYFKPKAKLGSHIEVFGRVGWANVNSNVSNSSGTRGTSTDTRDSGFSCGLGVTIAINKTVSVIMDYMVHNEDKGSKIDGITIGFGYKF